jgi:ketosteroid isomerase-like protein
MTDAEALLRRAYEAFNARDIEGALALMHPDVDSPNAWEGGRVHGHAEVREYWTRQFGQIDSHVEPQAFSTDDRGRVVVQVHQVVRDLDGQVIDDRQVRHVCSIRDGLVERMEVEESS